MPSPGYEKASEISACPPSMPPPPLLLRGDEESLSEIGSEHRLSFSPVSATASFFPPFGFARVPLMRVILPARRTAFLRQSAQCVEQQAPAMAPAGVFAAEAMQRKRHAQRSVARRVARSSTRGAACSRHAVLLRSITKKGEETAPPEAMLKKVKI